MELEVDFEHRLSLIDSTREGKIDFGWMDCHQMSDAFRFEELRSVAWLAAYVHFGRSKLCSRITPHPPVVTQ